MVTGLFTVPRVFLQVDGEWVACLHACLHEIIPQKREEIQIHYNIDDIFANVRHYSFLTFMCEVFLSTCVSVYYIVLSMEIRRKCQMLSVTDVTRVTPCVCWPFETNKTENSKIIKVS